MVDDRDRGPVVRLRWRARMALRPAPWMLVLCSCCQSHHVAHVTAKPQRYCKSTRSVELSWLTDASSVTVTATPPIPELSDPHQPPSRTVQIKPQATSIQLDVGAKDDRPVLQIAPLGPEDSALKKGYFVAACVGDAVVAPFDFDAGYFAPEVFVAALNNPLDVTIVVEHAGASWELPPGGRITFGSPDAADPSRHMAHTWTLRAPLAGGCAATTPRPTKLGVEMTLECAP